MKPEEAIEFLENICCQCMPMMQAEARRKVLSALDIIRVDIKKNAAPPEKEAQ